MYANNEIGTIQPIKEIAKEIRHWKKNLTPSPLSLIRRGVGEGVFSVFHTDAVQAVNYLDLNVETLGVDLLSLSGSKIEGSGRVGVLYKRKVYHLLLYLVGRSGNWLASGNGKLARDFEICRCFGRSARNKRKRNKKTN